MSLEVNSQRLSHPCVNVIVRIAEASLGRTYIRATLHHKAISQAHNNAEIAYLIEVKRSTRHMALIFMSLYKLMNKTAPGTAIRMLPHHAVLPTHKQDEPSSTNPTPIGVELETMFNSFNGCEQFFLCCDCQHRAIQSTCWMYWLIQKQIG